MFFDAGLRGAALALMVLLALDALLRSRSSAIGRITLLIDLCAIAFLIETAPEIRGNSSWWFVPLRLASNVISGVFVLWAEELFADVARRPLVRWLPVGLMAALAILSIGTDNVWAWRVTHGTALLLIAFTLGRVIVKRADDLVETRRRDRILFVFGVGLAILGTLLIDSANAGPALGLCIVCAVALGAALRRLHTAWEFNPIEPGSQPSPSSLDIGETEALLRDRLLRVMEVDRAYRDESMTIASLAKRLETPEYRLRQLINQKLGHRNFTSFVNAYRLAETQSALADPGQAQVSILTIAMDAGFASIGPFNRAFKQLSGETPTEYRRRALAKGG
jgi:AraC-like DNA-binding protein